jgi:ethanolamine utilization cobalamin adenosyltransferase
MKLFQSQKIQKILKNLSNIIKNSILDNRINYDTLHQQDNKNLVEKIAKNTE